MICRPAVLAFALIVAAPVSSVQALLGTLTGVVTEGRGGVIPGATISVGVDGSARTAVSNSSGRYRLEGIPAGTHRAEVRLPGFATRRAEIKIVAGKETSWDVVIGVRSAHSDQRPSGQDPTDSRLAAEVYEAILRRVYGGSIPAQPRIAATSLIQPYLDDADWPVQLAGVTSDLRQRSRTADALRPVRLRAESLPSGARLVESRGPTDIPITAFSRVFVSDDGLEALVVFEHVCGTLCAEGTVAWLKRDTGSAAWTIRGSFTFWIS